MNLFTKTTKTIRTLAVAALALGSLTMLTATPSYACEDGSAKQCTYDGKSYSSGSEIQMDSGNWARCNDGKWAFISSPK